MSSYLTGWQSQQNLCLQDICGLSTSLNVLQKCNSLNISRRVTPKNRNESKKRKYLIPSRKHSTIHEHPHVQKKEINIVAFNPYFKKFKSKITQEAKQNAKFLRHKQNIENQLIKKSMQLRNKASKPNSDIKVSIINVFERLEFEKPDPDQQTNQNRRKQMSFHKSNTKKSKPSKFKLKQISQQKISSQISEKATLTVSPVKFKYINLTSFQALYNEKNGFKLSRFDKIQKIASDYNIRKYM